MTLRGLFVLMRSDLYRHDGHVSVRAVVRHLVLGGGVRYCWTLRTATYLDRRRPRLLFGCLELAAKLALIRLSYRYGVWIPWSTEIGPGLYIGHVGGIVVNGRACIGRNCNLSHGVTIGQANRGANAGYPVIHDNVYIGPGAKIVGSVRVGNNVAIGANCVVTHDVPDNAVVVGVPGRVISYAGAAGYVNHTYYDRPRASSKGA